MSSEVDLTLDEAVAEVLGLLTGLDLTYDPELDRYRAITRQLNRALRANALEQEWSCYNTMLSLGETVAGQQEIRIPSSKRVRILDDDAVRLVNDEGAPIIWAYFLPRDSLHKYAHRRGLWCAEGRNVIRFSRPLSDHEVGLEIQVPVMREPIMFRLPEVGKPVPDDIRGQTIDFPFPDVVVARAAWYYAQTDPVMQPRAQTLEEGYKNLMYQLIERDTKHTDSAYLNEIIVPVESTVRGGYSGRHLHPHAWDA